MGWIEDRQSYWKIRSELIQIVNRMPEDYRYPANHERASSCTYWDAEGDGPDCIIGRLLYRLGVDGEVLRGFDCDNEHDVGIWSLYERGKFHDLFTRPVAKVLGLIQERQDQGVRWRELPEIMEAWWSGYRYAIEAQRVDTHGDV